MPLERYLRRREVQAITTIRKSTLYDMMARGEFPKPIHLGPKIVVWPQSVIAAWIAERAKATKGKAA